MAAKTKTNTKAKGKTKASRPTRSHRSRQPDIWRDDLGIGYATYDHEEDYVSPSAIDDEKLTSFNTFRQQLANSPLFVEVDNAP